MERGLSVLGIFVFLALAVALSKDRKAIDWRMVGSSLGLQFIFALLLLKTDPGQVFFRQFGELVNQLMGYSNKGIEFVFGSLANPGGSWGFIFAVKVLPTIIFFASLMNVLYYLGIMQMVVALIARFVQFLLRTSGAETLCASANIFMGQTEAPLLIRPYIASLTQSELLVVMVSGFSTLAAGVMFVYASMLSPLLAGAAGHLLAASVLSAPAAIMMAKILIPETEEPATRGEVKMDLPRTESNVIEAAAAGASTGLNLALNVGAMLIAFISLVALINGGLAVVGLSLEMILGRLFAPLALLLGISDMNQARQVGSLLGQGLVLNEFVAYTNLVEVMKSGALSPRSAALAIYALCGFTNLSSIAIQIGGIGALAEQRKADLARLGFLALFAALLANCQTAALAGVLMSESSQLGQPTPAVVTTASPSPALTATPTP